MIDYRQQTQKGEGMGDSGSQCDYLLPSYHSVFNPNGETIECMLKRHNWQTPHRSQLPDRSVIEWQLEDPEEQTFVWRPYPPEDDGWFPG